MRYKKKIIALSTLRQLGIIISRLALNLPILTFFHILTHALFKALLFIGAGALINYHDHSQDLRWIGSVRNQIPISTSCITIANMALCGFPFISGFYSKDFIIEIAINSIIRSIILIIILIRIGLTSFYSIRFTISTLLSPINSTPWINIKEENNINNPIIKLSIIAVSTGAIILWINPIRNNIVIVPILIKIIPTSIIFLGVILGYFISASNSTPFSKYKNINHYALCTIWFLVPLSTQFIIKYPILVAHENLKSIDQGWLEVPQLIHISITINNKIIILFYPKQANELIISTSICIIIIILLY